MGLRWTKFDGEYEKVHYDIHLHTGEKYTMCYPNEGNFHTLDGNKQIKGELVQYIKESKYHPMDDRALPNDKSQPQLLRFLYKARNKLKKDYDEGNTGKYPPLYSRDYVYGKFKSVEDMINILEF